jgi:hypothetical protein
MIQLTSLLNLQGRGRLLTTYTFRYLTIPAYYNELARSIKSITIVLKDRGSASLKPGSDTA